MHHGPGQAIIVVADTDSGASPPSAATHASLMNEGPKSGQHKAFRRRKKESSLCCVCCSAICLQLVFTVISAVLIVFDSKLEPERVSLSISSMRPPEAAVDLSSVVRWRKLPWMNGIKTSRIACELVNATSSLPFASLTLWPISIDEADGVARPTITLEIAPARQLSDLLNSWVLHRDTANARVSVCHQPVHG